MSEDKIATSSLSVSVAHLYRQTDLTIKQTLNSYVVSSSLIIIFVINPHAGRNA